MHSIDVRTCQEEIISRGPEATQLPASVFSLLSRKSFSNFVRALTDENFSRNRLFLISMSFNYCLSTMPFIHLSATLPAKSFKMQWHAGKTMSANNELITATSFSSRILEIYSPSLSLPEKFTRLLIFPFIPPFHFSSPPEHVQHLYICFGPTNRGSGLAEPT